VFASRTEPEASTIFDTYWRFAAERQNIYFRRIQGDEGPWTMDPILRQYKFTNAFRAADRTSQYLIRNVQYKRQYSLRDTVLRTLLFKFFNKVETWELLENAVGEITEETFDLRRYDAMLERALRAKVSIYSAAYIMPSGPRTIRQPRKHRMHLALLVAMLKSNLPERLAETKSMGEAFRLLLSFPSIGSFLAYQFVTDLNYSNHFNFTEMEFVVPGPGARDGLRKCFTDLGDYSEDDAIRWMTERQELEFNKRNIVFLTLWGRPLQLIDCQNLLCEVDKYARVAHPEARGHSGRTQIKQRFCPQQSPTSAWFPPKWNLNTSTAHKRLISNRSIPAEC
jgi:hypothetical protein